MQCHAPRASCLCFSSLLSPSLSSHTPHRPPTTRHLLHRDTLDELLPVALTGFAKCLTIVSTAAIVCAATAPAALAVLPFVAIIFRRLTRFFQLSAAQLKRLDKATSGPLFSLYSETLGGVASIRAFGLQDNFRTLLLRRLDENHAAHFL